MHCGQRVIGNQLVEDPQGIGTRDLGVLQTGLGQRRGGEVGVFLDDLDPQEIDLRPRGGRGA